MGKQGILHKNARRDLRQISSDLQREESIDDQVEVCRRYIERQGWTVAKVYSDRAMSGASRFQAECQQMIANAAAIVARLNRDPSRR